MPQSDYSEATSRTNVKCQLNEMYLTYLFCERGECKLNCVSKEK